MKEDASKPTPSDSGDSRNQGAPPPESKPQQLVVAPSASPNQPQQSDETASDVTTPGAPGYDPEKCLDAVLKAEGLNHYGDPAGLMYAGGTPLFNERTGTSISRREYIGKRRPELLERCPELPGQK